MESFPFPPFPSNVTFQTVAQNSLNRKDPFPLYRDSVTATGFFSNFPKNVIFGLDSRGTFQPRRHIFHFVRNERAWVWNIKCFAILRKAILLTKTMATTLCDTSEPGSIQESPPNWILDWACSLCLLITVTLLPERE